MSQKGLISGSYTGLFQVLVSTMSNIVRFSMAIIPNSTLPSTNKASKKGAVTAQIIDMLIVLEELIRGDERLRKPAHLIPFTSILKIINEPLHDKTNNDLCAQRRLRSAWISAQSDQSLIVVVHGEARSYSWRFMYISIETVVYACEFSSN